MKFYLNAATLIILYAIYGCFCAVITGLRICDHFEWMASSDLLYSTWNSAQCYVAGWMGGEYGEGCACVLSYFSRVLFCMTLWTVVSQAPLSMGFSRKEYWSGLPFPSPRESSLPRDQTWVSRIGGRRFNLWATREALVLSITHGNEDFKIMRQNTVLMAY